MTEDTGCEWERKEEGEVNSRSIQGGKYPLRKEGNTSRVRATDENNSFWPCMALRQVLEAGL